MIYKAFLNRQEITGFPVKGKETSEIWGGDTLLWKKEEQIKEAFTVDSYHIVATVTNGKVFAFFPIYTVFNLGQAWNSAFPSSSIDKSSEIVNVSNPHLLKQ
jgi:hypothetical protein